MSGTALRIIGGALLLACVLAFQPGAETTLQRLWLPAGFGLGALLVLQNLLAVSGTGALLALLRADLGGDWISAVAYPILGGICAIVALIILGRRFRQQIRTTQAARSAARDARTAASDAEEPIDD